MTKNTYELISDIIHGMPEEKKNQLDKACFRNYLLTSVYGLEKVEVKTYIEGWQVILTGTRCQFSVWAFDRDGDFEYGRKPSEKSLYLLNDEYGSTWIAGIDFNNV